MIDSPLMTARYAGWSVRQVRRAMFVTLAPRSGHAHGARNCATSCIEATARMLQTS